VQPFCFISVLYTKPARKAEVTKEKIIYKTKILKNKNMKTSIKTLIALTITTLALTLSAASVKAANPNQVTILTEVKKVDKISVAGNVELILVQSADESVKVYDSYFSKNALVQQKDGELRISSFNKEVLTVVVYVKNLSSITASGNSTIKTAGKFNTLSLEVTLKDKATAVLNTNTVDLYANLNGQSNLSLTGTTFTYNAIISSVAAVNMSQFTASTTNIQSKSKSIAVVKSQKAITKLEELSLLENS
jgi:hypothetical protein